MEDPCAEICALARKRRLQWAAAAPQPRGTNPDHEAETPRSRVPEKKVTAHVEHNCPGKGLQLVESSLEHTLMDVADLDDESREAIKAKFPRASAADAIPADYPGGSVTALQLTDKQLYLAMNELPKQSANGMSGWTFDLIRQVAYNDVEFRANLLSLFNAMLKNQVGNQDLWLDSRLVPLRKDNGDVRPICVGESIFRLLGRAVVRAIAEKAELALRPWQFGVGVPGGAEIVSHVCSLYREFTQEDFGWVETMEQLDIRNAFNTARRSSIWNGLCDNEEFLKLLPFFKYSYGSSTPISLRNGDVIAYSATGVRQGDPLGPFFFALALLPVLQHVGAQWPTVLPLAYLDDVQLLGKANEVAEAKEAFRVRAAQIGLMLNDDKCVTFYPRDEDAFTIVLGTPVGPPDKKTNHVRERVADATKVIEAFKHLRNSTQFALLQQCVNARTMYLARSVLPDLARGPLIEFDKRVDEALQYIIGDGVAELGEVSRMVRGLPYKHGGLSIRRLAELCEVAYTASFTAAMAQVGSRAPRLSEIITLRCCTSRELYGARLQEPFTMMSQYAPLQFTSCDEYIAPDGSPVKFLSHLVRHFRFNGNVELHNPAIVPPSPQAELTTVFVDERIIAQVIETLEAEVPSPRDAVYACPAQAKLAWFRSNQYEGSGIAFRPTTRKDLQLSPERFSDHVASRMLVEAFQPTGAEQQIVHCGNCLRTTTNHPRVDLCYHGLDCEAHQGMRIARHDAVRDALFTFLCATYGKQFVKKEYWLNGGHAGPVRADVLVESGRTFLIFDVSIVNPACNTAIVSTHTDEADGEDKAANAMVEEKQARYAPFVHSCRPQKDPDCIIPIVFNATGRIAEYSLKRLEDLENAGGFRDGSLREYFDRLRELLRKIRVFIARGNGGLTKEFLRKVYTSSQFHANPQPIGVEDSAAEATAEATADADAEAGHSAQLHSEEYSQDYEETI